MDPFNNWDEVATSNASSKVPLPHEDFDHYFDDYNQVDNMINETLLGLQDLDVPSGFANHEMKQQESYGYRSHQAKHSRKQSGTAIFGYAEHNKELSISGVNSELYKTIKPSMDLGKLISPGDLLKSLNYGNNGDDRHVSDFKFPHPDEVAQPFHFTEEEEIEYERNNSNNHDKNNHNNNSNSNAKSKASKKDQDYIITNDNPRSYKFPPSPSPSPSKRASEHNKSQPIMNSYSAKYLQDLNMINQGSSGNKGNLDQYADDIGPLLEKDNANPPSLFFNNQQASASEDSIPPVQLSTPYNSKAVYKYVPIPVRQELPFEVQKKTDFNPMTLNSSEISKTYLPPPSPPTLSNGSPDFNSSPEPQSPSPSTSPSNRPSYNPAAFSSPVNPQLLHKTNFYTPQFFSDDDRRYINDNQLSEEPRETCNLNSSPIYQKELDSSPNKFFTSPLRNVQASNDDTVDANTTLTPVKNGLPITPMKNKVTLEWSPIISPNAKSSKDVRRAIQQSSPRRKVKKTSLLPPGELDQYWKGPDADKIFTCTYKNCGKKFTRRYNVRSHIQTHLSDRPFACSYCPKKFVRQHDLNRHVKGHLEARYCRCLCGKEFSRLDALKKHRARNICLGGLVSNENHCVTKPPRKVAQEILDELTSGRLAEDVGYILPQ